LRRQDHTIVVPMQREYKQSLSYQTSSHSPDKRTRNAFQGNLELSM
jgi:hypothetical protein